MEKRSKPKIIQSESGFSLIELMAVIAIIGVLSSMATASYSRYAARARQVEAKLNLANFYTGMKGFWAEKASYTACVAEVVDIEGRVGIQNHGGYYEIGFSTPSQLANFMTCGAAGTSQCLAIDWPSTGPLACSNNALFLLGQSYIAATAAPSIQTFAEPQTGLSFYATSSSFLAAASGNISETLNFDVWSLGSDKKLIHRFSGL